MAGLDEYVKLLLHGNGADGSTDIVDSSPSPKTVSVVGDAQIDTAQSKFGGASILMDGTSDNVYCLDSTDWDLDSDDFTIDTWIKWFYFPAVNATVICQHYESDTKYYQLLTYYSYGSKYISLQFYNGGQILRLVSSEVTISNDTWYHIAAVKNGTSVKLYLNGAEVGSTTYESALPTYTGNFYVGSSSDGAKALNGWLDEFRFSKGIARWTSNFTPPTNEYSEDISRETADSFSVNDSIDAIGVDNLSESFSVSDNVIGSVLYDAAPIADSFSLNDMLQAGFDHEDTDSESFVVSETLTLEYSLGSTQAESFSLSDSFSVLYADVTASASNTFPKMSNISYWGVNLRGSAIFPKFSGISRHGVVLVGDATFPKMSNACHRGTLALTQVVPKFDVSGSMTIRSALFANLGTFPKLAGSSVMKSGLVMSGVGVFPLMVIDSGNAVGSVMATTGVFPLMRNRSVMRAAGRFTNYILRYVR
jgi:hypothetical protein